MIIAVKESKLDSVQKFGLFKTISISKNEINGTDVHLMLLRPTEDLLIKRKEKAMCKDRFKSEFKDYLKSLGVDFQIYSIGNDLKRGGNICLVSSDDEFDIGYPEIVAKYISKLYGVPCYEDWKDAKKALKDAMSYLDKKKREIIEEDPEDLSEKKQKIRKSLIKDLRQSLDSGLSEEGKAEFKDQKAKFNPYVVAVTLINQGAIITRDNKFEIDVTKCEAKRKDLIDALLESEDSKFANKIIRRIVENHQMKLKEKHLKDATKENLLVIFGEIFEAYTKEMYEFE